MDPPGVETMLFGMSFCWNVSTEYERVMGSGTFGFWKHEHCEWFFFVVAVFKTNVLPVSRHFIEH